MAALVCEICGGKLVVQSGGVAKCDSCGMEYTKERIQEKIQEIKGTVKIDGPVEAIKGDAEKERLLSVALECRKKEQYEDAIQIYNSIIKDYPSDWKGYWGKIQSSLINDSAIVGVEIYSFRELYLEEEYAKVLAYAPESMKKDIALDRNNRYKIIEEKIQLSINNANKLNQFAKNKDYQQIVEDLTGLSFKFYQEKVERYIGEFCLYQTGYGPVIKKINISSNDFERQVRNIIDEYNSYLDNHKCPLCHDHKNLGFWGSCKVHGKVKKI